MPSDDKVQQVFSLARSASKAKLDLKAAANHGLVAQYHRTKKSAPHLKYESALTAVKKQLTVLSKERARVQASAMPETRRALEIEQITQAMTQIADGTLRWLQSRMAPPTEPDPVAMPQQEPR